MLDRRCWDDLTNTPLVLLPPATLEKCGDGMLDYEELLALASKKGRRGSASRILSKIKEKVRAPLVADACPLSSVLPVRLPLVAVIETLRTATKRRERLPARVVRCVVKHKDK